MTDLLHCDRCRAIFDPELWPKCPVCPDEEPAGSLEDLEEAYRRLMKRWVGRKGAP